MEFAQIGQQSMQIEEKINQVLLEVGQSIKIHTIDKDNMIIELDYEKYVNILLEIFKEYSQNAQ